MQTSVAIIVRFNNTLVMMAYDCKVKSADISISYGDCSVYKSLPIVC